jgi:hypothetical protein
VLLLMVLLVGQSLDKEDVVVSVLKILVKRAANFIPGQISKHFCVLVLSSPSLPKITVLSI